MVQVTKQMMAQAALTAARNYRGTGKFNDAMRSYNQAVEGFANAAKEYSDKGKAKDAGNANRQKDKASLELRNYKQEIGATRTGRYTKVA